MFYSPHSARFNMMPVVLHETEPGHHVQVKDFLSAHYMAQESRYSVFPWQSTGVKHHCTLQGPFHWATIIIMYHNMIHYNDNKIIYQIIFILC